jgi:hypothetical protein
MVSMFVCAGAALAADVALSTHAGWFGQDAADREMALVADEISGKMTVETFTVDDHAALATWVENHTGNGGDLLILCGQFPSTIYAAGNTQADDSLAELFLDAGNTIINTGDYMFYVVDGAGTNGDTGLMTMMDIDGISMWDDDTPVIVTAEGANYTPSLSDFATDRPFHLDELDGGWEPALIMAQNEAGTRADPAIVRNVDTGGMLGIFYQTASQDDDPRGLVISEFVNSWYGETAVEPVDSVTTTWGDIKK